MQNKLPEPVNQLLFLADRMAMGLDSLGESLGITQITPTQVRAAATALLNAEAALGARRASLKLQQMAFAPAEATVYSWLLKVRGVLTTHFGPRWNGQWSSAGFANHSTAVPDTISARVGLVAVIVNFLTANPTYAVPASQVTAAEGVNVHYNATAGLFDVVTAETAVKTAVKARDAADKALRTEVRSLINLLTAILGRLDARWGSFGLNQPGADGTPGQPQDLTAEVDGEGNVTAVCAETALALRYRFRAKIVGATTGYALVGSSRVPRVVFSGYEPGTELSVIAQAVNGPAQSVASEAVLVTIPMPPVARRAAEVEVKHAAPAAKAAHRGSNGSNGASSNGHREPALTGTRG